LKLETRAQNGYKIAFLPMEKLEPIKMLLVDCLISIFCPRLMNFGLSAMFTALNLCGISGNFYTETYVACRDMPHAKKAECRKGSTLETHPCASQSILELTAILRCMKNLGNFGIKNTIFSAP